MSYIVDSEVSDNFTVLDSTNNFVIGINTATFETQLYDPNGNDVVASIPVTISELDDGNYRASFTPNLIGSWYLVIIHPTYSPTGKAESYWIEEESSSGGGGGSSLETNPLFKTVNFGMDTTGLTTVGYSLIDYDGTIRLARTTENVFELKTNCGVYGVYLTLNDPWNGLILWDDGQDEPVYASEQVNIDSTAFITSIVNGIDTESYKLDAIYEKLPENDIADSQDSTTIINTTATIENTVNDIEDKIDIIDNNVDILNTDCTNMSEVINTIDNNVNIIDDKVDDLAQDATTIINTTTTIENTVNDIENKIDILNTDCTSMSNVVNTIDANVDIIDNKIDILSSDATTIINTTTDIQNTVNDIDDKVDILNTDCTNMSEVINNIDNNVDIIDDKIDNISLDTTGIINSISVLDTKIDNISDDLKRSLGLMHENIFIDLPSYDDDCNLISARVRIYSDSASVGTNNNIIGTYAISSDTDGPGKFTNWKQEKI